VLGILGWDGCLGEYIILPNANLHVLPDCVSDKEAVFCEPLASALQILEQVQVRPQDRVVVLGDGKLGLLIAQVLRFATADLVVIGRHQVKLGILSRQGIKTQIGTKGVCDVDIVVECTGKPEGFQEAISMVKPGGKVILKSTFSGCSLQSTNLLVINEITVLGSRCGPFRPAIMWLKEGRIDTSSLITEIYSLKMGLEAFRCSRSSEALKVLVRP
jgi:threonine dehydrogenase-like Zn-dependent dehydrogenase